MTRVLCHIPPFCSISEWYLILKIIYSVTKYLIKRPVVYFLSSVSTSKNCSDMYVIRHIITEIMYNNVLFIHAMYFRNRIVFKLITKIIRT